MLIRKIAIALVATAALGLAALPTDASAQSRDRSGWHGGHNGGHSGWHGGGHNRWYGGWRGGGWRGGWYGGGWYGGGWGYPYAYVPAPYYGGCYRAVRVGTPWGPRWRRVWVCG